MSETTQKRKREALGAERIAMEALALVDERGLEGFSFRILAARLGCEAMSLYHYYPSKQHLFDAMVELYYRDLSFLPEDAPWLDRLRAICWEFRAAALRHPGFFQFVSVYRMNSRAGLSILERMVRAIEATGLDTAARARHFRVIGYFITGAALDETLGYAKGPSAAEPVPGEEAQRDFPSITEIGRYFGQEHHASIFEQGVEVLLADVAAEVAALPRPIP